MSLSVVDRDNGYSRLLTNVRRFRKTTVRVGVTDAPHEGTPGMSVADIGAIHELGLGNAPPRSFLRAWVDANERGIMAWLRTQVLGALLGSGDWADAFGRHAVAGVRQRIIEHIPPPLEDETVRRKHGEDTPLVDTQQLLNGIIYDVKEGA